MKNGGKLMKTLEASDINTMLPFSGSTGMAHLGSAIIWGTSPVWNSSTQICNAIWGTRGFSTPPQQVRKPLPALQLIN